MTALAAVAARTVGRTVHLRHGFYAGRSIGHLLEVPAGACGTVLRVTSSGLIVRLETGETIRGVTASDVDEWRDD